MSNSHRTPPGTSLGGPNIQAGNYPAFFINFLILGEYPNEKYGGTNWKCYFEIEIPEVTTTFKEEDGSETTKPVKVGKIITYSASPRSHLRKLLESWRGKAYASDEEAKQALVDLKFVGLFGEFTIIEKNNRADISGAAPLRQRNRLPEHPYNAPLLGGWSIEDFETTEAVDKSLDEIGLSPKMKEFARKSLHYQRLLSGTAQDTNSQQQDNTSPVEEPDDLPF